MTEKSFFWDGTVTGDAALAPYDEEEFQNFVSALFMNYDRAEEGVIHVPYYPYTDGLNMTLSSDRSAVFVSPGVALVNGVLYTSGEDISFNVQTQNVYYRLILQMDWDNKVVRMVWQAPMERPWSLWQVHEGLWEIPLWLVHNSGGTVTIYDQRKFVGCAHFPHIFVPARVGYQGATAVGTTSAKTGVTMADAVVTRVISQFNIPIDYVENSQFYAYPVLQAAATGNLYTKQIISYGGGDRIGGFDYAFTPLDYHTVTKNWAIKAVGAANVIFNGDPVGDLEETFPIIGDLVTLQIERDATGGDDTIAGVVYMLGWNLVYNRKRVLHYQLTP